MPLGSSTSSTLYIRMFRMYIPTIGILALAGAYKGTEQKSLEGNIQKQMGKGTGKT